MEGVVDAAALAADVALEERRAAEGAAAAVAIAVAAVAAAAPAAVSATAADDAADFELCFVCGWSIGSRKWGF